MSTDQVTPVPDFRGQDAFAALSQRVKQLRYLRGLGPDELASQAGISRTALYQIENGRTEQPRAGTVRRLAEALGVEPAELFHSGPIDQGGGPGTLPERAVAEYPPDLAEVREAGHDGARTADTQPIFIAPVLLSAGEPNTEMPPWLRSLELERKFRRLLNSPFRDAVSRIIEESYRLLPPEPFERSEAE